MGLLNQYPNAWQFSNADKQTLSPNKKYRVIYGNLEEFAMGGPIGGACRLVDEENRSYLIDECCGGPPVWSADNKVALGKWFGNTTQQILVLDPIVMEITVYKGLFVILNLREFEGGVIKGIESPIHEPEHVMFDTQPAEIDYVKKIETGANNG